MPAAVALDRDRLEAGEVRRGRVGAVGAVGNQDLRPLLAPVAEVGRGDQQRGELALGAGRRLEADGVQARRSRPGSCCSSYRIASSPWSVLVVLVGMLGAEAGQRRQPLVPLRVVLHRARAERIEVGVDRHVQRRQVRVVPDHVELAQLGQRQGSSAVRCRSGNQRRRAAGRARRTPARWPSRGRAGWTRRAGESGRVCT